MTETVLILQLFIYYFDGFERQQSQFTLAYLGFTEQWRLFADVHLGKDLITLILEELRRKAAEQKKQENRS
jgi:hypothetical protein